MADLSLLIDRHQLMLVDPEAWTEAIAMLPPNLGGGIVSGWAARDWPLVARRGGYDDLDGMVPLGLPLPPILGRHRLMLRVPPKALRGSFPPPLLHDCAAIAPPHWRRSIDELLEVDSAVRCFGSLAWQYLTGLPYLNPASDLDLLWMVDGPAHADTLVQQVVRSADRASMRIDGELVMPSGQAVQWCEWLSGAPELVAKSIDGVTLLRREMAA